jgi:hypothetical protein
MTAHPDLDDRLRAGLRAAARDLPPWDAAGAPAATDADPSGTSASAESAPAGARRAARARHRRWGAAGLAALAAAATVAAVVALAGHDRPAADVRIGPPASGRLGDLPPGSAVLVDEGIRIFDADGRPAGLVDVGDGFLSVSSMVSVGDAGWVVCGMPNLGEELRSDGTGGTTMLPVLGEDHIYRIPPEGPPVDLGPGICFTDLLATEVAGRTVVLAAANGTPLQMIDAVTGERTNAPIDDPNYPFGPWMAGGGRFAVWLDGRFRQWDLATGEALPDAPVTLAGPAWGLTLSPDASTLAYATGEQESGRLDLVVVDMATGAELFRRTLPLEVTTSQLAYDGHTLAVNAWDPSGNTVGGVTHVIDVATGAEHTVDAVGLLP